MCTDHAGSTILNPLNHHFSEIPAQVKSEKPAQHHDNKRVILQANTTPSSKQSVYPAEDPAGHFLLSWIRDHKNGERTQPYEKTRLRHRSTKKKKALSTLTIEYTGDRLIPGVKTMSEPLRWNNRCRQDSNVLSTEISVGVIRKNHWIALMWSASLGDSTWAERTLKTKWRDRENNYSVLVWLLYISFFS